MSLRIPPAVKNWWSENWRRATTLISLVVLMTSLIAFERYQESLIELPAERPAGERDHRRDELAAPAPAAKVEAVTGRHNAPSQAPAAPVVQNAPAWTGQTLHRPLEGAVQRPYGWGLSVTLKEYRFHTGVDLDAPVGAGVQAAYSGKVMTAGQNDDGLAVLIDHGGGRKTYYANLGSVLVRSGDRVAQAQLIGRVGTTMDTEVGQLPHLHFELFEGEDRVDPKID